MGIEIGYAGLNTYGEGNGIDVGYAGLNTYGEGSGIDVGGIEIGAIEMGMYGDYLDSFDYFASGLNEPGEYPGARPTGVGMGAIEMQGVEIGGVEIGGVEIGCVALGAVEIGYAGLNTYGEGYGIDVGAVRTMPAAERALRGTRRRPLLRKPRTLREAAHYSAAHAIETGRRNAANKPPNTSARNRRRTSPHVARAVLHSRTGPIHANGYIGNHPDAQALLRTIPAGHVIWNPKTQTAIDKSGHTYRVEFGVIPPKMLGRD